MSNARDVILKRIRTALRDVGEGEQVLEIGAAHSYQRTTTADREAVIARFVERVRDYKAAVRRIPQVELQQVLTSICLERGIHRLVVPPDLPASWVPLGVEMHNSLSLSYQEIESCDGVLTGCAVAIAQTGTIVLDGGAVQGRRVITLLPDYHLCVVHEAQVVDLVPEAITQLGPVVRESRRPITFISGPSATSDIELNRVEGVHGPRTLEVLVISA